MEEVAADITAETHCCSGPEPDGAGGENDLDHGETKHDRAHAQDVFVVADQYAVVDQVGVQRRQREGRECLDRLQADDEQQHVAVWPEVALEKLPELHPLLPTASVASAVSVVSAMLVTAMP